MEERVNFFHNAVFPPCVFFILLVSLLWKSNGDTPQTFQEKKKKRSLGQLPLSSSFHLMQFSFSPLGALRRISAQLSIINIQTADNRRNRN